MATSGTVGTLSGSWGSTYRVTWSLVSQNIANNTSTIRLTSTFHTTNTTKIASTYSNFVTDGTVMYSGAYSKSGAGNIFSKTKDITVSHNADGTFPGRSVSFSTNDYIMGNKSGSGTISGVTTIPRSSSISSISGSSLGSSVTVNISRASTSFTHKVEYSFAGSSYTTATSSAATSATFTPSLSLANHIPNATSGTLTVRVTTYSGSTQIGNAVTKTQTLSLPGSVLPTLSGVTLTRVDNGVPSSWGVYVQGYSKVTATIAGASGIYGSSISGYSLSGAGYRSSSSSLTTGVLNSTGTFSFSGYVTDSRGRSSSSMTSAQFVVYEYFPPSISVSAQRCTSDGTISSSGTYLKVHCTYSYASVNGKNTISRSVTCNRVSNTTFSSGTSFIMNANCAIGSSYTLTAEITDGLGNSSTVTAFIPTAERVMNIKSNGKGVAFGGFSTKENTLQCYWDLEVNNYKVATLDSVYPVGSIYISVVNTNPSSLFGGTWVAFASGRTLVGVDTSQSDFSTVQKTGGSSTVTLTSSQMPSHTHSISHTHGLNSHKHSFSATTSSGGSHAHNWSYDFDAAAGSARYSPHRAYGAGYGNDAVTSTNGAHTHSVSGTTGAASGSTAKASTSTSGSAGSGGAHSNLQPYITVYMWRRTA
ncbi:DUF859 family phage minor structural protein [Traorella massiliensis]|uniref:DUF859 family phage minor structural protein n=1 Tax=Traorella massiliensis TaxID=1903263 RepID=UPI00248E87EB|nr:DUF859 family phage minor structural protein [Traorella massiliensis]